MLVRNLYNFLDHSSFHIDIYDNKIHICNYKRIISLGSSKIIIKTNDKKVSLIGNNFSLNKLADNEILIIGNLESLEIKDE